MYLRIHKKSTGTIIASCDEELLGKELAEGEKVLDLRIYSSFYNERKVDEAELIKILKSGFTSANLVGKKVITAAIKAKIIEQNDVMHINRVPYIQIYLI